MLRSVREKIRELHMIDAGDKVLTGVSGGADSVCLLLVLHALSQEMNFCVKAVHVEHGIRGEESCEDAAFVKVLCQQMQIPLYMISVDVPAYCEKTGLGLEEAARELRYQAFQQLALKENAKVALAHHMEDNAETMLFQLARGSSITGLCGMQPIRRDEGGITYIRPLLYVHREEVEHFLELQGQDYRVDSTNAELVYSRNYIRNIILPEFQKVNVQAIEHMNATASQLADIRDYLEQGTQEAWEQVVVKEGSVQSKSEEVVEQKLVALQHRSQANALCSYDEMSDRRLILDIERLEALHPAVQKEVLYKAIAYMRGRRKDIALVHVMDVLSLCRSQSGKRVHLSGGLHVQREYKHLKFFYKEKEKNKDNFSEKGNDICVLGEMLLRCPFEIFLNENGEKVTITAFPYKGGNVEIPQKPYTKWMDYDKIKDGFCIRTRRSGDSFIGDAEGHRKKLKQYLIDEKIPVSKRDAMWLLAQEDVVLWLIGGRMSEHVKVTADTKTIIEITYDGGC